jgi:hypothetical protein
VHPFIMASFDSTCDLKRAQKQYLLTMHSPAPQNATCEALRGCTKTAMALLARLNTSFHSVCTQRQTPRSCPAKIVKVVQISSANTSANTSANANANAIKAIKAIDQPKRKHTATTGQQPICMEDHSAWVKQMQEDRVITKLLLALIPRCSAQPNALQLHVAINRLTDFTVCLSDVHDCLRTLEAKGILQVNPATNTFFLLGPSFKKKKGRAALVRSKTQVS